MFRCGTASAQARTVVLIASIVISTLIGLAACGSVTAGGAGHRPRPGAQSHQPAAAVEHAGGRVALRGRPGADRVVVSRIRFAASRQVTLHGATQVQAMVAALCALPSMPPGQHCPAAVRGLGPAGVRGRRAELPAGQRAGVGLPRGNRTRGAPVVVPVIGVRPDAQRGGRRHGPTGPRHPPEQRADRAVTGWNGEGQARAPGGAGRLREHASGLRMPGYGRSYPGSARVPQCPRC